MEYRLISQKPEIKPDIRSDFSHWHFDISEKVTYTTIMDIIKRLHIMLSIYTKIQKITTVELRHIVSEDRYIHTSNLYILLSYSR